ncbi:MAG: hypothetical protein JXL80_08775 [Planctomycetes bacterium]|nr:hypothetical protein [Planctomycetota bacterium]
MRQGAAKAILTMAVAALAASGGMAAETKVGPRGQVIVDGKPTIPLAVWVQPQYTFAHHRQLGLNLLINPHVERGAFRDKPPSVFPAAEASRLAVVQDYDAGAAKEAALWGWNGGVMVPGRLDRIKQSYESLRAKDPGRLVMFNISIHDFLDGQEPQFYRDALPYTNAVISHVWPELSGLETPNLRNVAAFVDRVREYCKDRPGGEVSIWPDINPHEWHNKPAHGGRRYPAPTREQLRFQIWLALIHGADGICFFPISFDPFVFCQIPAQNEEEIARNTQLIERLTPVLTADESDLALSVASDRPDGIVDFTTRRLGDRHYVFLLNGQDAPQTVRLKAPGLGTSLAMTDEIAGKPVAAADGEHVEALKPLELRIWRLSPAAAKISNPDAASGDGPKGD